MLSGFPSLQEAFILVLNSTTGSVVGKPPHITPLLNPQVLTHTPRHGRIRVLSDAIRESSPALPGSRQADTSPFAQTAAGGTLITAPGFVPAINANIIFGGDHLFTDPDGSKLRINVNCIATYVSLPSAHPIL